MARIGAVAEPLLTMLKNAGSLGLEIVAALLEQFGKLPDFIQGGALAFALLLAAAGPVLTITSKLITSYQTVAGVLPKVTKFLKGNTTATAANATAANAAGKAQLFLSKALAVGKFLAIGAAIAAAGYLLYKFAQDSDAATAMINGFVDKVVSVVESLVQALPALIPKLTQAAIDLLLALVNAVPQIIPPLVNAIPQLVIAIAEALPELIPVLIDGAVQLLMALIDAIPIIIPPLVNALPQIITAIVKGLIALAGAILQVGVQLLSKLWSGMSSKTGWLKEKVFAFAKSIPGRIKAGLGSLFGIGRDFMQGLLNGVNSRINAILSKLQNLGSRIKSTLKRALEVFSPSRFTTWLGEMLDEGLAIGIVDNTKKVLSAIRGQSQEIHDEYSGFESYGLSGPMPQAYTGRVFAGGAASASEAAGGVNQTINIYQPVETPAETARAIRNRMTFGLAGE
ncbi:MAG: hypothetical protein IKK92_00670 [Prevotella sp.]|nr:hypothetical protein [Prevotella sp.]